MSSTEILEGQLKEMRDELASMNRAVGSAFISLHSARLEADSMGAKHLVGEIDVALNTLKYGDMYHSGRPY